MSLVGRLVSGVRAQAGDWPTPKTTSWLQHAFSGGVSASGQVVSVEKALTLDSVVAAVRLLSESVGALPLKVYQRTRGGQGRVDAWFEPVYRLLHEEPNREMTAIDLWSLVVTHLNTWGNAYIGKSSRRVGKSSRRVAELWPIVPRDVQVSREKGVKTFTVTNSVTGEQTVHTTDIIHIHGISLDGLVGLSPIGLARNAIGRGIAGDEFSGSFLRHSAIPRGVLKLDGELAPNRRDALREQWQSLYGGANAGRVAILEGGMSFQPITMPLEDAQFVEQEKLSVQKIARIFGVPASMIGGETGDSLTYATVEGNAIQFERYSLRPWITRIEQALARDRDLFPGEGRSLFPEFLTDAILRSDTKTRFEAYSLALDPLTGWMNRDEVRQLENLPPEQRDATIGQLEEQFQRSQAARAAATNGGHR